MEKVDDDAVQVMTAAKMRLDLLCRHLQDGAQVDAAANLSHAVSISIRRLRHLLFELTPPALDGHGLAAALRVLLEQATDDTDTEARLECRLSVEPDRDAAVIAYRIVQEALVNARKHARARTVTVSVGEDRGGLRVRVGDDGAGFGAVADYAAAPGHLGLAAMRERAQMAGGWWTIESSPGAGTTVEFWVPALPATAPPVAPDAVSEGVAA